ncbi:hypothetical protein Bca52824_059340 [Brassica carinata]|uniref:Uncharacterized protein n=1 Tax=Brassica carinata TaxID=52824 RepID=A0A8X7QU81_BRACI|nr:hypothetical protein Bca52824_059340 [Brassica carinata]
MSNGGKPFELRMYISQQIEHGIETACKIGNADISKALWACGPGPHLLRIDRGISYQLDIHIHAYATGFGPRKG